MTTHADEMATVWVLRAGDRDRLVTTFLDDGIVGLAYPTVPDGATLDRVATLRHMGAAGMGLDDDGPSPQAEAAAALFLSFVRRVRIGDIAAMLDPHAGGLVCGVVAGDYHYDDTVDVSRNRHRRSVEWRRRLPFDALPERLETLPAQRSELTEQNDGRLRTLAQACCALDAGDDPFDRPPTPVRASRPRSTTPRAPRKPPQATAAEKRCVQCFVSKSADLFEDGGEWCRDCL